MRQEGSRSRPSLSQLIRTGFGYRATEGHWPSQRQEPGWVRGGHSWKRGRGDAQRSHSTRRHRHQPLRAEGAGPARMPPCRSMPRGLGRAAEQPLGLTGAPRLHGEGGSSGEEGQLASHGL